MPYLSAFASVYDSFTEDVNYKIRAEYILSLFAENGKSDGILLDVACGTGTLTKYLSESDFDLIAVDISYEMLSEAKNKFSKSKKDILFLCQDMRELDLYGTIDCAVCSLDSVNHLIEYDDVFDAFSRISLFMNPGGIFIFDVNTVYKHKNILSNNTFAYENEDAFLVWQNSDCDENNVIDIMLDVFIRNENGSYERTSEDFAERAYEIAEISELLQKTGFKVVNVYGDMTRSSPDEKAERIYFIAEKK